MDWLYHPTYPTRDGAIPWRLFVLYTRALPRLTTRDQLEHSYAVSHGYISARLEKTKRMAFDFQADQLRAYADATPSNGDH